MPLNQEAEKRIRTNPLLNIDTFIIPSPYIKDPRARKDPNHSYIWREEGEILGYLLTYVSADSREYLIYKLVTSPYGRGRGIGTAFVEHLARSIPENSRIYLYVWEKQHETVEFFRNKGFHPEDSIVYRNMVYHRLETRRETLIEGLSKKGKRTPVAADEIGRTRHDARKTLSSLTAMVNALAPHNAGRIIEDINRETTTLINMLNMYRDSMFISHSVNLQDLVLERLVTYIETCGRKINLTLNLSASKPMVFGHWLNIGRALVNLASNSIDAMADNKQDAELSISLLDGKENDVLLRIADNGHGIPEHLMILDDEGKPAFVGTTTKAKGKGEGFGTAQVWSSFGSEHLAVESRVGEGTVWTIRFDRSDSGLTKQFSSLQRRFNEIHSLSEDICIDGDSTRNEVVTAIWRVRKKEIFLFELLEHFSREHNIRDLFRSVLTYWQGGLEEEELETRMSEWKGEHESLNTWVASTARMVHQDMQQLKTYVDLSMYRGALLKSYGQSLAKAIIFTLSPANGDFLATDRKLAEHLDFVKYLGGDRKDMLRGEFAGDVNISTNPIYLGVWSVDSEEDIPVKLQLLQDGARCLLNYGLHSEKRLSFYQSTYIRHSRDINSDASCSLGEFAAYSMDELKKHFVRDAEDDMQGFLTALD